jgi:ribosomal protein L11 methyltransferase
MIWHFSIFLPQSAVPRFLPVFEAVSESVVYGEDPTSTLWKIEAYCEHEPNVQELELKLNLAAFVYQCPSPALACEVVPDINWVTENYRQFPPLEVGSFYIYRSHHTAHPPQGFIPLQLDVATAFGSGEHASTKGCLMALQQLAKTHQFQHPLDLGCGSGILAMAIARLWDREVLAVDNDPEAVRVTALNSEINALKDKITPALSEGLENPLFEAAELFDLIVANILADPLIDLAPGIHKYCAPQGYVILSGFLTTQLDPLLHAYAQRGFTEQARAIEHEWVTAVLRKA